MLTQSLSSKTIAIIGYQSLTGQLIFNKIFSKTQKAPKIFAIQIGNQETKRNAFLEHPFLNHELRQKISQIVDFCSLSSFKQKFGSERLDLLILLYEPCDFSKFDKVVGNHLLNTTLIVKELKQISITRSIVLSSIYCLEPGYLSEQNEVNQTAYVKKPFSTKQQAFGYLNDNFDNNISAWKWSILFMENMYASLSKQTTIVRVPALGPTYFNNQAHVLKLNYFTYLMMQLGTGKLLHLDGKKNIKIDIVPNDFVSNLIVVLASKDQTKQFQLIYLSTTTRNYITLRDFVKQAAENWPQLGKKRTVTISQKPWSRKLRYTSQEFPSRIKQRMGSLFDIKSWKIQGNRTALQNQQKRKILQKYRYFLQQEWLCQSIKSIDLFNQLTSEQQQTFNFNVNTIQWPHYIKLCVFATRKYLLRQSVGNFNEASLAMNPPSKYFFSDIMWALNQGKSAKGQTSKSAVEYVLNSKSVKKAIKDIVEANMMKIQNAPISYQKAEEQYFKIAEELCLQMFSDYSMGSIRLFGWFLHKLFNSIYDRVIVDQAALDKLKNRNQTLLGPLIIMPTHRSYIDFLIISYIFFGSGIKVPHIAAAQDFLSMAVIHVLLRKSGAFFIKRNQKKHKELYKAIIKQYMTSLVGNNHYIQFFIEGTRSRTGKMMTPKFGILSLIVRDVAQGRVNDASILPVTINYQRILQGQSYTYQMMGETKVKQSLSRVFKAVDVLKENYGRIYLELCPTISIRQWIQSQKGEIQSKIDSLGNKIVHELSANVVITQPAVVSTIVLMHRKGISQDSLQQKTKWLCDQIVSRGIKVGRSQGNSSIAAGTMGLLKNVLQKSKKDMFQILVRFDQRSFVQLFTLTYYRNTLTHIFFQQAIVIATLASFGHDKITQKHTREHQLRERSLLLWKFVGKQYFLAENFNDPNRFKAIIELLQKRKIIRMQEDYVFAVDLNSNYYNLYWSILWPLIETYWAVCLYFFKLVNNPALSTDKLYSELQWFAQSLFNQHFTVYPQSISSDTIKNAVSTYKQMGLLGNTEVSVNGETVNGFKLLATEEQLKIIKEQIELFLKRTYAKSIKGMVEGAMSIDFPFLSKL